MRNLLLLARHSSRISSMQEPSFIRDVQARDEGFSSTIGPGSGLSPTATLATQIVDNSWDPWAEILIETSKSSAN